MTRLIFTLILSLNALSAMAVNTELKYYRPFNISDPVIIATNASTYCSAQSMSNLRKDAWRCSVGGKIYDPCFTKHFADKNTLICPESPWSNRFMQIKPTHNLNNQNHRPLDMSKNYPWALVLNDGTKCLSAASENRSYDHQPIRYRCQDNSFLFGHIHRCTPEWKILRKQSNGVNTAIINKVIF